MVRLALDLGIFKIVAAHTGPVDVETIVNEVGVADETLLRRVLRTLDAMNAINAIGEDSYEATKFTGAFNTQKGIAGQKFSWVELAKVIDGTFLTENCMTGLNSLHPHGTRFLIFLPNEAIEILRMRWIRPYRWHLAQEATFSDFCRSVRES